MTDSPFKAMSVEEYLRTEEQSPFKREYVGGFVYPLHGQSGASEPHVLISGNVFGSLRLPARASGCRAYQSDMRLRVQNALFYPDVMVVCDGEDVELYFKTTPCLLVEVLSSSTAANDRVGKYQTYTTIPSLQTYLIVEQDEQRVYAYQRGPDGWNLHEFVGSGDIPVPCLGRSLSLDEVYDGVR